MTYNNLKVKLFLKSVSRSLKRIEKTERNHKAVIGQINNIQMMSDDQDIINQTEKLKTQVKKLTNQDDDKTSQDDELVSTITTLKKNMAKLNTIMQTHNIDQQYQDNQQQFMNKIELLEDHEKNILEIEKKLFSGDHNLSEYELFNLQQKIDLLKNKIRNKRNLID